MSVPTINVRVLEGQAVSFVPEGTKEGQLAHAGDTVVLSAARAKQLIDLGRVEKA